MQIEIANPAPGGAQRTSVQQAERFIRRGEAVMLASGRLMFLAQALSPAQNKESKVERIVTVDRWSFPHTQWITV
jgi:hypothetical protein